MTTLKAAPILAQLIMGFRTTQLIYVTAQLGIADLLKSVLHTTSPAQPG